MTGFAPAASALCGVTACYGATVSAVEDGYGATVELAGTQYTEGVGAAECAYWEAWDGSLDDALPCAEAAYSASGASATTFARDVLAAVYAYYFAILS